MAQMYLSTKQKQTHRHREQICGCQGGRNGMEGEFGVSRYLQTTILREGERFTWSQPASKWLRWGWEPALPPLSLCGQCCFYHPEPLSQGIKHWQPPILSPNRFITPSCLEFFFFCFLGPHPWHREVPRVGIESELWPLAYTTATATAMPDPSRVCHLHHSSWQCWILNPFSEARDQTHILTDTSQVRFCWAMTQELLRNSYSHFTLTCFR